MPTILQIVNKMKASGTSEGVKKAWDTRGRSGGGVVQKSYPLKDHSTLEKVISFLSGEGFKKIGDSDGVTSLSHPDGHTATVGNGSANISAPPEVHDRLQSTMWHLFRATHPLDQVN